MHACGWNFYTGVDTPGESRLICSWDTTPEDLDAFVADLRELTAVNFKRRTSSSWGQEN
jgi:threonine aldolase